MKLTIESTATILRIDGTEHRLWTGTDAHGTPVHVFVRTISPQTHDLEALARFDAEFSALPGPKVAGVIYDLRFFTD